MQKLDIAEQQRDHGGRVRRRILLAWCAVLSLGVACAVPSSPDGGTATSTSTTVPPHPSTRYFGDAAPWNKFAEPYGRLPQYQSYVDRLWDYSNFGSTANPSLKGQFSSYFQDYSVPIYDAREATTTIRVFKATYGYDSNLGNGASIPWNPAWVPAPGNDHNMVIVDPPTGREWDLWLVQLNNYGGCVEPVNILLGYAAGVDLCVGTMNLVRNPSGGPADIWTSIAGFPSRGMGLPKLALTVRPEEVASGYVDHALALVMYNAMFGPQCTNQQMGTAAAGVDCGFYLNPATRFELSAGPQNFCGANNPPNTSFARSKTIPKGMRFGLDITDAEITSWLDSRGYTGARRTTAKVLAESIRRYGFIAAESSCYDAGFEFEGMANTQAKARWAALGVTDDSTAITLLHGLFKKDSLYVVNPSEPIPVGR